MLRWNARFNLTAIRDPHQIVTRHFGESLFLARHLFPAEKRVPHPSASSAEGGDFPAQSPRRASSPNLASVRVVDIGSGAGFPGLPLKIWAPTLSLTLVESNHKKAAFLREVVRATTLTGVNVLTARAETLVEPAGVVTLRAVERFDAILPIAARLVAPGGRLALLVGASQLESIINQGIPPATPIPVPLSDSRVLSIHVLPS